MKNKTLLVFAFSALIIACLLPVIIYSFHFQNFELSSKTNDWGAFGSYLSGTVSPFIAVLSLLVIYWATNKQVRLAEEQHRAELQKIQDNLEVEKEEKNFNEIHSFVLNRIMQPADSSMLIKDLDFQNELRKTRNIPSVLEMENVSDDKNNSLVIVNHNLHEILGPETVFEIPINCTVFDLVLAYIGVFGPKAAREHIAKRTSLLTTKLDLELKTVGEQLKHLVLSAERLNSYKYSSSILHYKFTMLYDLISKFIQFSEYDAIHLSYAAQFWSLPPHTSNSFSVPHDFDGRFFELLKQQKYISNDEKIEDWSFDISNSGKKEILFEYSAVKNDEKFTYNAIDGVKQHS